MYQKKLRLLMFLENKIVCYNAFNYKSYALHTHTHELWYQAYNIPLFVKKRGKQPLIWKNFQLEYMKHLNNNNNKSKNKCISLTDSLLKCWRFEWQSTDPHVPAVARLIHFNKVLSSATIISFKTKILKDTILINFRVTDLKMNFT